MKFVLTVIGYLSFLGAIQSCSTPNTTAPTNSSNVLEPKINISVSSETIRVEFCEMVANAKRYDKQKVMFRAKLITGREYAYLYDLRCSDDSQLVMYESENQKVVAQLDKVDSPDNLQFRTLGLIRLNADFAGTLYVKKNGFGHMNFFNYKFVIDEIANISEVPLDETPPWHDRVK